MQVTYGLLEPFSHGRGYQELVTGTSPAAGANYTHKLAGKWVSRLLLCSFQLTTSVTTADRIVTVEYATAAGTVYAADGAAVAVEASTTSQQFYGSSERGQSEWNTGTPVFFPLWGGFLYPGFEIIVNVAGYRHDRPARRDLSPVRAVRGWRCGVPDRWHGHSRLSGLARTVRGLAGRGATADQRGHRKPRIGRGTRHLCGAGLGHHHAVRRVHHL